MEIRPSLLRPRLALDNVDEVKLPAIVCDCHLSCTIASSEPPLRLDSTAWRGLLIWKLPFPNRATYTKPSLIRLRFIRMLDIPDRNMTNENCSQFSTFCMRDVRYRSCAEGIRNVWTPTQLIRISEGLVYSPRICLEGLRLIRIASGVAPCACSWAERMCAIWREQWDCL
jgi:hypothetical protein